MTLTPLTSSVSQRRKTKGSSGLMHTLEKKFSSSKEVTNVAQERHKSGRQIQAPSELSKAEVPHTKQKYILSVSTSYHPIYTKSSRHNTAPKEMEG